MKNFYSKSKGKGKIHPSPASPSPLPWLSVLNLLPAAILALIAVLSSEEKEALAYMLRWSMRSPSSVLHEKRECKKPSAAGAASRPLFDCDCFNCYTSYWLRWNSSPNRQLIDQAIDTFEERLANGESTSPSSKKGRKKDRRGVERSARKAKSQSAPAPVESDAAARTDDVAGSPEPAGDLPATKLVFDNEEEEKNEEQPESMSSPVAGKESEASAGSRSSSSAACGRVLGRKMWPDMMGMFNSRMWGLWNPTV